MSNGVDFKKISLENRELLNSALAREDALREELAKQVERANDFASKLTGEQQRLTVAEQRVETLTAFAQQIARQQGEPYFSKLAKAALKPAADAKSSPPCPNCKVCMGSPDFPENCLINGVKP